MMYNVSEIHTENDDLFSIKTIIADYVIDKDMGGGSYR